MRDSSKSEFFLDFGLQGSALDNNFLCEPLDSIFFKKNAVGVKSDHVRGSGLI